MIRRVNAIALPSAAMRPVVVRPAVRLACVVPSSFVCDHGSSVDLCGWRPVPCWPLLSAMSALLSSSQNARPISAACTAAKRQRCRDPPNDNRQSLDPRCGVARRDKRRDSSERNPPRWHSAPSTSEAASVRPCDRDRLPRAAGHRRRGRFVAEIADSGNSAAAVPLWHCRPEQPGTERGAFAAQFVAGRHRPAFPTLSQADPSHVLTR